MAIAAPSTTTTRTTTGNNKRTTSPALMSDSSSNFAPSSPTINCGAMNDTATMPRMKAVASTTPGMNPAMNMSPTDCSAMMA